MGWVSGNARLTGKNVTGRSNASPGPTANSGVCPKLTTTPAANPRSCTCTTPKPSNEGNVSASDGH